MTIGLEASLAAYETSRFQTARQNAAATSSSPQPVNGREDSVQLSPSAQQYVADAQKHSAQQQTMVMELARAAASGDAAALSLLTIA